MVTVVVVRVVTVVERILGELYEKFRVRPAELGTALANHSPDSPVLTVEPNRSICPPPRSNGTLTER